MIKDFNTVSEGTITLVNEWGQILLNLDKDAITGKVNSQGRTIKQITGHMADSASNNLHRIVHLQYRESPLTFPNYATDGNNDRWIAIQNFQEEDWHLLVNYWKYTNFHIAHVIRNIDPGKIKNEWISVPGKKITLEEMVIDYLQHLKLHLNEITELIEA